MCENKILDVLIIGAGPIGLACGIEAEKNGLSYQIVDKGKLVNSIYNYPHGMRFFSSSEKLEIGGVPFISHTHKPTRAEALEYYRRVAMSWDLNITLYNKVESVEKKNDLFRVKTAKGTYTAQSVVIATGFYDLPHKMGVPGEELSKVMHYYKEPHPFFGQNLAVVGASNSAVDAALECYRKGAKVTMIVRGEEIGRRVKYWVKPDIENRIAEGSIKALFNSQIEEIKEDSIKVDHNGEKIEFENDFVLALTGYEPNYSFLEEMGITFSKDGKRVPTHNTETMETNIDNIFLAGVICGGMETHKWFIENSRVHAEQIMKVLKERSNKVIA
ncbi:YpdA family putative bacillithiol disulfide reductase [Salibacter halophilus]|uniref:YpdA family putative bacillithiol disulfide reductase n=1 Tax=Salibacter halophilus TaxID=1803916 RepID=A0A6N6MAS7_9FLAO|nr:YpdA family putative bacillithiol disulfide reductase [Salibacter halophilus]KAB1066099.1 YpdA family putative bacillithiol disulfide reductase [Salibacter halophilus]